ncbi:MAG: hypothetical protein PHH57_05075 [Candidatus Omnitrophica bacterium]|nr:hypothetical protein [Candidatus Omnitrophota bacterium]
MSRKMKLFIGLLVLGLLLIGSGGWLLFTSAQAKVSIPEGTPVIYEKLDYIMRGQFSYLYIYEDGSIILIEEKGLRMPSPGHPPTRTWKTGKLTPEQLDSLIEYLKHSGLNKLEERYQFPGKPIDGGGFSMGDMGFTVTVNHGELKRTVTAFGYLTPDQGETYPDMPSPLNDIYVRLKTIALATREVYQESISQ